MKPLVEAFFDGPTGTLSYLVCDRPGGAAVVIDPVLDYDANAARVTTGSADRIIERARAQRVTVNWVLETHAHADHLTAAAYLHTQLGAAIASSRGILAVQRHFAPQFGLPAAQCPEDLPFDRLLDDTDRLQVGELEIGVVATPGHTPDSISYLIGDAAFMGDTLFAPDVGTARCDFPGGDARQLYASIQRLLGLSAGTTLYLCHDYPVGARAPLSATTIDEQRANNIHLRGGVSEEQFVEMRTTRDRTLAVPKLILPALQVNICAGRLPPADPAGIRHLRLPINIL